MGTMLGKLRWYPLNYAKDGAYGEFERVMVDVRDFIAKHEPTIDFKGMDEVLRYNFVSDKPTSILLSLVFEHPDPFVYCADCGCPDKYMRVGHLWVSVDAWFGNPILNIMQYEIHTAPDHSISIEDKKELLDDVIRWGKALGATELRTVAYGDVHKRAYRMFYGIDNVRNDYVIRKTL